MSALLQVSDLDVGYRVGRRSVSAVAGAGLTIGRGEVVAVVGESGSGKSTTAHALLGLLPRQAEVRSGTARLSTGGKQLDLLGSSERRRRSIRGRLIGFVPQDPMVALNPVKRIGDQIAEVLLVHRLATRSEARARAIEAIQAAGLDQPSVRARQFPHELSGGMRQRALIAQALIAGPALLIADEPTSALDVTVQRHILDQIAELTLGSGTGVLLITHDLGVAAERADRIVVMKSGRVVEEGTAAAILHNPQHPYTVDLIASAPSLNSVPLIGTGPATDRRHAADIKDGVTPRRGGGRPLLEVRELIKDFPLPSGSGQRSVRAVDQVSFVINSGETYGLVGESGSGKSTTARIAARLVDPSSGSVLLDGQDISTLGGERLRQLRRRFQVVYQNPYASLDPRQEVASIITEPLRAYGRGNRVQRRQQAAELLGRVALPSSILDRRPAELSGGQRQRVAIARALALRPELVILDEPVSALDVSVQARILELLVGLQSELGLAYLFISHDLAVVRQIAHRVGVMRSGQLVETGPTLTIFDAPTHDYTRDLLAAIPEGRS